MSNQAISNELDIPIKSIERILSEINKRFNHQASCFNPRVRLLLMLVARDILDYQTKIQPRFIADLGKNLSNTMILSSVGFSNKTIASIFDLSEKAVELRFSQLFDYFNVDTKNQKELNPRILLFISAYCRRNLTKQQLTRLFKETSAERLESIFTNKTKFLLDLQSEYKFIG